MANNTITVFEHSKLHIGEQGFKEHHLDALAKYNDLHGGKYFTPGYNKITFKSYVGVIQAGDKIIEVLPKVDNLQVSEESTRAKWQSALLYMLRQAGYIKLNETERAFQQSRRNNLLDIYLYSFLKEVEQLVHAGLVKKYQRIRKNQTALKGRLLIAKQIQYNIIHKERFFTEHTVYDRNNIFNALIKKALEIIRLTSFNYSIKQDAAKQLLSFEDIDSWKGKANEFDKLVFDRKTKPYTYAIELARMIILNYCPDMTAGNKPILAILFDMNRLFEKFIFRTLKKEENRFADYDLSVLGQNSKVFWGDKPIRPDILIDYSPLDSSVNTKPIRIIIDTKWKVINAANPSDDDLKQMYAYNFQFGSLRSVLFYPSTGQRNTGVENYEGSLVAPEFIHGCELYFAEIFKPGSNMISETFGNDFLNVLLGKQKQQEMTRS